MKRKFPQCECQDPGCPVHKGQERCSKAGLVRVARYDYETQVLKKPGYSVRPRTLSLAYDWVMLSGFFFSIVTALGEEIGWRGLLDRLQDARAIVLLDALQQDYVHHSPPLRRRLAAEAPDTVTFVGSVSDEQLRWLLVRCRLLVAAVVGAAARGAPRAPAPLRR